MTLLAMLAVLGLSGDTPPRPAPATESEITAPGPSGPLAGTLLLPPGRRPPTIVIVPGSGPTDRNGNSPLGVKAQAYRLLAEALAQRGIATVRIDKRGMFGSRAAIADGNAVTVADYAADAALWVATARAATGARCVWLAGHSEGGLVVLSAARAKHVCGLILLSAPGRPFGTIIREQLRANPGNAPILAEAFAALDRLEHGEHVDTARMTPALLPLFGPPVQNYLMDLLRHDPARLLKGYRRPVLILQGERDLQVSLADAGALAAAYPRARLTILPGVNHVLKTVTADDPAANFATYADPSLPLAPGIADAIADFVRRSR